MIQPIQTLRTTQHDRDNAGLKYIYHVLSRRAGGISVGINLNTNNACNWACVYCQVDNLQRGSPPPVDLQCLQDELTYFLSQFIAQPKSLQEEGQKALQLVDIAFSGNGEPTSAAEFSDAVMIVHSTLKNLNLAEHIPIRLITNGSLIHRSGVQQGLRNLASHPHGEVWFKVDRADPEGIRSTNKTVIRPERQLNNLRRCAEIAPTWVQTCWFAQNGQKPDSKAETAYLNLLRQVAHLVKGVHLYGLARPSMQPERHTLQKLEVDELEAWAEKIEAETGISVKISP